MKLGVNNDVNLDTKKVGVRMMNGGHSKLDRPTSHPSNPIKFNKLQRKTQSEDDKAQPPPLDAPQETSVATDAIKEEKDSNHKILKSGVIIFAAVAAFVIYRISR